MVRNRLAAGLIAIAFGAAPAAADNYHQLILQHKYSAAAALLKRSAAAGKPIAQYRLAVLYRLGLGVKRDDVAARRLLASAAKLGNADAASMLRTLSTAQQTSAATDVASSRLKSLPAFPLPSVAHVGAPQGKLPDWPIGLAARKLPAQPGLAAKGSLETQAATGETPLLIAARINSEASASTLLEDGANMSAADKRGWTAWMWAARNGDLKLLGSLIGLKPKSGGPEENQAAKTAIRFCQADALSLLIKAGAMLDASSNTDLKAALADGNCTGWEQLASGVLSLQGLDKQQVAERIQRIRQDTKQSPTPEDYGPLHLAALGADPQKIRALLAQGADPNALTKDGSNALMLAAARNCVDCVNDLIPVTADLNLKNSDEETALYIAVKSGSAAAVKLLLDAGASPDSRNLSRDTPAKLASRIKVQGMQQLFSG